jgi:hypothetical protein
MKRVTTVERVTEPFPLGDERWSGGGGQAVI